MIPPRPSKKHVLSSHGRQWSCTTRAPRVKRTGRPQTTGSPHARRGSSNLAYVQGSHSCTRPSTGVSGTIFQSWLPRALAVPQQRQLFVLGPSSSSALPRPRQQLFHPLPSFSCCCWSRRRLASCSATSCSPACANAFLLEGLALLPHHPLLDPSAPRSPQFCDAAPASNHVCHGAFTQEIIQRGRSMIIAETSFTYHRIPMPRCIYKV